MRGALVLNACSSSFPDQVRQLAAFAAEKVQGVEFDSSLVVHCGGVGQTELVKGLTTGRAVLIDIGTYHPQTALEALPEFCGGFDVLLFPGNIFGEEVAARLGFRLGGTALIAATGFRAEAGRLIVEKQVYSHHLNASLEMTRKPACLSMARGGAGQPEVLPCRSINIETFDRRAAAPAHVLKSELKKEPAEKGLAQARLLIAAGKGVGSAEGVGRLAELARLTGGRLGVSRPVAMNAWAPLNQLIGVSGVVTQPELCLAFGVSGAPAFYAGIEKSRVIVSVNNDPKAPMIGKSDGALIADCGPIIDELTRIVSR